MEKYILGLDLGTASLGWALIKSDESIVATGVRIFPEATEGKKENSKKPKNVARREYRLSRRQTRRTKYRKESIRQILSGAGLLPNHKKHVLEKPESDSIEAKDYFTTVKGSRNYQGFVSPYSLRKKALDEKLNLYDLGRIFFHLSRRIGFQMKEQITAQKSKATTNNALDKTDEDKKKEKENAKITNNIETLKEEISNGNYKTLGAYLDDQYPHQRRRHLGRKMVMDEFETIWLKQKSFYPDILTDELKQALRGKTFDRQPVFWRWKTIGICEFEPDSPLIHKSDWLAQQFIMLQDLNNLRLVGGNQPKLDNRERDILLPLFKKHAKVTFSKMRKELESYWKEKGTLLETKFNFEVGTDSRTELSGNATEAMLINVLGDHFPSQYPMAETIRNEIAQRKWDIHYRETYKGFYPSKRIEIRDEEDIQNAKQNFINKVISDWKLTHEQAQQLADYSLPKSWMRFSRKAIQGLVEKMTDGTGMTDALDQLYPREDRLLGQNRARLPSHHRHLPDIRNPVVIRCLNEVRKVVNNIIRCYGKPDYIRIEMARDVKLAGKKKIAALEINKDRRKKREKARDFLGKRNIPITDLAILKYMLWKETDHVDIYSGDKIGCDELFRQGEYQIEHIIPKSRSRDDSFNNFLLCRNDYNRKKSNKTPYQSFGQSEEWKEMDKRANKHLGGNKLKRFLNQQAVCDISEERSRAQLNDTAYAARVVRDFLACLYPKGEAIDWSKGQPPRVQATNGQITSQTGKALNLYRHFRKWFVDDNQKDTKDRGDYRHHALDAVVIALTTPQLINRLAQRYNSLREKNVPYEKIVESLKLDPPWPSFYEELKEKLSQIVVSKRVDGKVTGALTSQTQHGRVKGKQDQFVKKELISELSFDKFCHIRDKTVQNILWDHMRKYNADFPPDLESVLSNDDSRKSFKKNFKKIWPDTVKKSFTGEDKPYTKKKDGSCHYPIKKVRITVKQRADLVFPANTPNSFYFKGDNHHIALYQKPDGKIEALPINKAQALKRIQKREALVSPTHPDHPDWPLVFSLCKQDILQHIDRETKKKTYYYVYILGEKQVSIRSQYDAGNGTPEKVKPDLLKEKGYTKVSVDPIGCVRKSK